MNLDLATIHKYEDTRYCEGKMEREKKTEAHLEHASKGQYQTAADANQEDGGNVEEERDRGVRKEDQDANFLEFIKWGETFCEGQEEKVDEGADRSVVVQ